MRSSIWCVLVAAASADSNYDPYTRSNCDADGRRLQVEHLRKKNMTFLVGGGPEPPPLDDQHIFKGDTCIDDCFVPGVVGGVAFGHGGCSMFACDAWRHAFCAENSHCKCPAGSCAVAEDEAKPDDLSCQIRRVKAECPPNSGVYWMMEHIEVEYDKDKDACIFVKTTGIDEIWDAVAWTDNANLRDVTWHTIGKNADRDFGYSSDPISDSVTNPIVQGVAVSMNIKDELAPPNGLVVKDGGHTTTVRMEIEEERKTKFWIDGKPWGMNHNLNVALHMHGMMWIKQRCGKLMVTNPRLDVPCLLEDWTSWGDCHPATEGGQTCGPGVQERTRGVTQQGTFSQVCTAPLKEHQSCNQGCCPVNCLLSDWSAWGDCTEECGGGSQTRTRNVTQQPSCGGVECEATTDSETCNLETCPPQDCEWSPWGDYSDCSADCDGGTKTRERSIQQESRGGGEPCREEDSSETNTCNTQPCKAIDCEWTAWGDWSECNAACNGGVRSRSRSINQEAHHGGDVCDAASATSEECNVQACTDTWTAGDGADIGVDGVTFSGEAADAVVTSQFGVESISVRNGAASGSVQIGLAADAASNFDSGVGVVLPYKGAKDSDIVTVGTQHGHGKVFLNNDPTPVEDLGKIANALMAKVILDEGASVRVSGITEVPPPSVALPEKTLAGTKETHVTAGHVPWYAAMAAVSVSMVAVIVRRSQPAAEVQQPLLQ